MGPKASMYPRRRSNRRGATVVEFALVVPLFITLLFAALEFGRFVILRNTAQNAAYEGARVAMLHGSSAAAGAKAAVDLMRTVGASNVRARVRPRVINDNTPEVKVTVTVPFDSNAYLPPIFARGVKVTGTCTLATEGYRIVRARPHSK